METDNETDTTGDWGLPWNAQCPVHGVARIMHGKYDATNGHGRQLALDFSTVASPNSHSTPLSSILPTPSVGLALPLLPLTVLPTNSNLSSLRLKYVPRCGMSRPVVGPSSPPGNVWHPEWVLACLRVACGCLRWSGHESDLPGDPRGPR